MPETPPTASTAGEPARYKVGFVKNTEALQDAAADRAREEMNEDLAAKRSWLKKILNNIWTHNLAREHKIFSKTTSARQEMAERKSLFADDQTGEKQAAFNQAMLERFVHDEFDADVLMHKEAGERVFNTEDPAVGEGIRQLETDVRTVLREYLTDRAQPQQRTEDEIKTLRSSLEENIKRLVKKFFETTRTNVSESAFESGLVYATNCVVVAENMLQAIDTTTGGPARVIESINDILKRTDVVFGEAKTGVRTERIKTITEKITERVNLGPLSGLMSPEVLSVATTVALNMVQVAKNKTLYAVGGVFGIGAVSAFKEYKRTTEDRAYHLRDRAKGYEFDRERDVRRAELETSRYEVVEAALAAQQLKELSQDVTSPESYQNLLAELAAINARIEYSDKNKKDLIVFSAEENVEAERLELDIARARAKVALKNYATANGIEENALSENLQNLTHVVSEQLVSGENGIAARDRIFEKIRRKRSGKAFLWGAALSGGTLLASEQIQSLWNPGTLPVGPNQSYNVIPGQSLPQVLLRDGSSYVPQMDANGILTQESIDILTQNDYVVLENTTSTTGTNISATPAQTVVASPDFDDIKRVRWYDNDTPAPNFDQNELRMHWGGDHGTGINASGDYVYDITTMTRDGSFHGANHPDVLKLAGDVKVKLFLSLTEDTQSRVVAVDVVVNGGKLEAVIEDEDIKRMFFVAENGAAKFIGKFAEIGHVIEEGANGAPDQIAIFSTDTGPGNDHPLFGVESSIDKTSYSIIPAFSDTPQESPDNYLVMLATDPRKPLGKRFLRKNTTESTPPEPDQDSPEEPKIIEIQDSDTTTESNAESNVEKGQIEKLREEIKNLHAEHVALVAALVGVNSRASMAAKVLLTEANAGLLRLYNSQPFVISGSIDTKLSSVTQWSEEERVRIPEEVLKIERDRLTSYGVAAYHAKQILAQSERKSDNPGTPDTFTQPTKPQSPEAGPKLEVLNEKIESIIEAAFNRNRTNSLFGKTKAQQLRADKKLDEFKKTPDSFSLLEESRSRYSTISGKSYIAFANAFHGKLNNPDIAFTKKSFDGQIARNALKLDKSNQAIKARLADAINSLGETDKLKVLTLLAAPADGGGSRSLTEVLRQNEAFMAAYIDQGVDKLRNQQLLLVNNGLRKFMKDTNALTTETDMNEDKKKQIYKSNGLQPPATT